MLNGRPTVSVANSLASRRFISRPGCQRCAAGTASIIVSVAGRSSKGTTSTRNGCAPRVIAGNRPSSEWQGAHQEATNNSTLFGGKRPVSALAGTPSSNRPMPSHLIGPATAALCLDIVTSP